jgi:hypothetical protein
MLDSCINIHEKGLFGKNTGGFFREKYDFRDFFMAGDKKAPIIKWRPDFFQGPKLLWKKKTAPRGKSLILKTLNPYCWGTETTAI